jgi:hypothetical protein
MRLGAAVIGAAVVAVSGAQQCPACSCVPVDLRDAVRNADAAFVGVLLSKRAKEPRARVRTSADAFVYTFRVEERLKGPLGATVAVEAPESGASCGLEVKVGARTGLFVHRRAGAWTSTLCQQAQPAQLRAAARALPRPNGRVPAALVVAGAFGEARTIALDARGRTLAYGFGRDDALRLAVCPGGRAVAELVASPANAEAQVRIAVRTLPRLRLVREVGVPKRLLNLRKQDVRAFECLDLSGRDVAVLARRSAEGVPNATTLFRLRGRAFTMLYKGFAEWGAIGRGSAYLVERGGSLVGFDLRTRTRRAVATIPRGIGYPAVSPDARYVAGIDVVRGRIARVRLADGDVRTAVVPSQDTGAALVWTRAGRLLVLPTPIGTGLVYDASLRRIGRLRGWSGSYAAIRGRTLYGATYNGYVLATTLPRGAARRVRALPGQVTYALAAVP